MGGRKMATTRRELLGASASAAFGLFPLGGLSAAVAQIVPGSGPTQQPWDAGELVHVLPTSSQDRILLKTSFKRPWRRLRFFKLATNAYLDSVPILVARSGNSTLRN